KHSICKRVQDAVETAVRPPQIAYGIHPTSRFTLHIYVWKSDKKPRKEVALCTRQSLSALLRQGCYCTKAANDGTVCATMRAQVGRKSRAEREREVYIEVTLVKSLHTEHSIGLHRAVSISKTTSPALVHFVPRIYYENIPKHRARLLSMLCSKERRLYSTREQKLFHHHFPLSFSVCATACVQFASFLCENWPPTELYDLPNNSCATCTTCTDIRAFCALCLTDFSWERVNSSSKIAPSAQCALHIHRSTCAEAPTWNASTTTTTTTTTTMNISEQEQLPLSRANNYSKDKARSCTVAAVTSQGEHNPKDAVAAKSERDMSQSTVLASLEHAPAAPVERAQLRYTRARTSAIPTNYYDDPHKDPLQLRIVSISRCYMRASGISRYSSLSDANQHTGVGARVRLRQLSLVSRRVTFARLPAWLSHLFAAATVALPPPPLLPLDSLSFQCARGASSTPSLPPALPALPALLPACVCACTTSSPPPPPSSSPCQALLPPTRPPSFTQIPTLPDFLLSLSTPLYA
ncbi:unnamed protein product, partial [Trichogramma brassicae]